RDSSNDQRGGATRQRGREDVFPDGPDDRHDAKTYRSPGVPEGGDCESPEGNNPGDGDSRGPPAETAEKEQAGHGELHDPPAEPPIRPSDGKVDPAMRAVEKHDSDPWPKDGEDPTRLFPPRPQQYANQIPADERETRPQPHADEGESRQRAQETPRIVRRMPVHSAQCGHSDGCERSRELVGRKNKQVVRLLVEPQRLRAKDPSHQEVVYVPGEVVRYKARVGVHREPNRRDRTDPAVWEARDPSTRGPGPY